MRYPDREQATELILDIGRRMEQRGYVVANDGNISCLLGPDQVLSTPTGVSKGHMTADMLVETDLDGGIRRAGSRRPSSELKMHLRVYRENPDLGAVVHAHPVTATCFAAAGICLDEPILTEAVTAIGSIPVAPFAVPSTQEVPDSIAPFCNQYNGALLANHGVITWAEQLEQAFFRLEWVEVLARATLITKYILGRYNRLSEEQVAPFSALREQMGIQLGGEPMYAPAARNAEAVLPRSGPAPAQDEEPGAAALAEEIVGRLSGAVTEAVDAAADRIAARLKEEILRELREELRS